MALQSCNCCSNTLPANSKNRVTIRNRTTEYSTLYDIAIDVLKVEQIQLRPEIIHKHLDGNICKVCFNKLKKLTEALKLIEPIKLKLKEHLVSAEKECSPHVLIGESNGSRSSRKRLISYSSESTETPVAKRVKRSQSCLFTQKCAQLRNTLLNDQEQSPQVAVVVGYKSKPKVRHLTHSLKRLGKCIGRGRRLTIVKAVMQNPSLRPQIASVFSSEVKKEIKHLSSCTHDSILRMKTKDSLERFTWDRVWTEIETCCPLLTSFLKGCLSPKLRDNDSSIPPLCLCASILLKLQNSHINLVQAIISMLLKSGHANKQVFTRLQKVMLCLSYTSTLNVMDVVAEGFDQDLLGWKELLLSRVNLPQSQEMLITIGSSSSEISSCVPSPNSSTTDSLEAPEFSPINSSDISSIDNSPPASSPENSVPDVPPVVQSMLMSQKNMDGSLTKDSEIPVQNTAWQGYVFAGDNLDRNIRPRHQTVLSQTRSVHWFNSIAVQDRCDFSLFADTIPTPNVSSFDLNY